jgi:hypothetical protein
VPDFFIHSGVRKRHTRLKRMLAPTHAALVQHIGGFIVRRNRPVRISADRVLPILDELQKAEREGRLELRTGDGRLVDLERLAGSLAKGQVPIDTDDDFETKETATVNVDEVAEPPRVSPPLPQPPLDSAANDKPAGQHMPPYYEGTGVMADAETPVVLGEQDPVAPPAPTEEEPTVKEPKVLKGRKR